jgi:hypothetical protein
MYDQGQIPKQTLSFPLFGGDSSEEFFIWRKTVKNKINFLQWGDEIFLRFLPTILKDRALHYYEHLDKSNITSTDDALTALNNKFGFNKKNLLQHCALLERSQGDTESVENYTKDVLHNFEKLGLTDKDAQMRHYSNGLRADIKFEVLKLQPQSLNDLEESATNIELINNANKDNNYSDILNAIKNLSSDLAEIKSKSSTVNAFATDHQYLNDGNNSQSFPSMHFCKYCGCSHIYGQHVSNQNTYPSMGSHPNQIYSQPEAYHYQQSSSSFPDPQCFNPSIICYQCGGRGHIARKCRHYVPSNYLNIQGASNT